MKEKKDYLEGIGWLVLIFVMIIIMTIAFMLAPITPA